ncbi:MAG: hypothetical protein Pg6B_10600 [Candidatus Azobacteroides pseudotrichonymphae]|nr:MAG: hypothetical protein Pg6B_10600 [Candidatus Azobacteroides pseudotrichonymphae]
MRYLNRQDWCPAFFPLFLREFQIKEIYRMIMLKKLKGYFSFKGRIGRKEYIISSTGFAIIIAIMNDIMKDNNKDSINLYCQWILYCLGILFLYFIFAQGSKRCHDLGRSAWWQFVPLFPLRLLSEKGYGDQYKSKERIGRKEYIISTLFKFPLFLLWCGVFKEMYNSYVYFVFPLWFWVTKRTKRCHDLGRSGWWQMIPFYGLWLLFSRGQKGSNQYGEDPMELTTPAANASE